jgi:type IV pilus assembly protein PilC
MMEAPDRSSVLAKLREGGLLVSRVEETKTRIGGHADFLANIFSGIKMRDVAVFSKQFAAMINAGLTMIRCLRVLEKQASNPAFKDIIASLREEVTGGSSLSTAMSKHPKAFSRLYVAMVRAGEESGSLDVTLNRLANHLEKEVSLRDQVSAGTKYPQAIAIVAIIIVTFLMIFVIPTFRDMFSDLGSQLPLPTQILMFIATSMRNFWYIVILILVGVPIAVNRYSKTASGREVTDRIKLRLPVFGLLSRKISVARFTRTLGTLLASGVSIIKALSIVEETAGNVVIEHAIQRVRESIKEGESIADPLEMSGVFPPMVTSMIAVGEESGALDDMLNKIADFYDAEVESMVKALTSLLEPVLISVMGGIVGFIVISLLLPMFKLIAVVRDLK